MVAMIAQREATKALNNLFAAIEPPELGPGMRPGARPQNELESALTSIFAGLQLSSDNRDLVRALVLLWHDHLDAAHSIAQGIENPDGSLIHAIMHRREPDFWNSKYWWRRVGQHPCFPKIAQRVMELLQGKDENALAAKLVPNGKWDAFAFVDACEAAAGSLPSDERVLLLREVQRIESEVALEHLLGRQGN